jgi:hypothetical protein
MRRFTIVLAAAIAGGLLATTISVATVEPFDEIPRNVAVLFVGSCNFSYQAFRKLSTATEEVRARVLPVPVENDEVIGHVCPVSLARLRSVSWRVRLLPASIACRRLVARAHHYFYDEQKGSALPAFAIDRVLVPQRAERTAFAILGLSLRFDDQGIATFERPPAAGAKQTSFALDPKSMIGQTIGY